MNDVNIRNRYETDEIRLNVGGHSPTVELPSLAYFTWNSSKKKTCSLHSETRHKVETF